MEILFKREQTAGRILKVKFKLWAKLELDEDEQAIVRRYDFNQAVLIAAVQPTLIRNTALVGAGAFFVAFVVLVGVAGLYGTLVLAALAGGGTGFMYFTQKRETIFVKDLLHGRNFTCDSVIDLARKEAWLDLVASYLRQVMESAKHWDGTEHRSIEALPKEEARQVIIRGL